MTVLLLRLAGPLQSWGSSSRFSRRTTDAQPTKSGIIGLLAAAQGRRRTDDIEDLMRLRFGVRLDQPGTLVRDFQTARSLDGKDSMPLSYRFYWADATFLAAVESDPDTIRGLDEALRSPTFPLYLGRRSCPPAGPVTLGERPTDLVDALRSEPWQAAPHWQKSSGTTVRLEIVRDAFEGEEWSESFQDTPVSFDPRRRQHALRGVVRDAVVIDNPRGRADADHRSRLPEREAATATRPLPIDHEPFSALGGS